MLMTDVSPNNLPWTIYQMVLCNKPSGTSGQNITILRNNIAIAIYTAFVSLIMIYILQGFH